MALFKRKQQVQTQIPELQEYYATQKQSNTALAWLLAIGSLLVTIAIFVLLFLGGRWLYRELFSNDDSNTTTSQTDSNQNSSDQNTNQNQTENTGNTQNTGSSTQNQPQTTAPQPGVSPNQTPAANQNSQAANTTLPNSGPEHVVALFIGTTIIATVVYRRKLAKSL